MQSSIDMSDFSVLKYSVCSSQQTVKFKERENISIIENQCLIDFIRMHLQTLEQKIFCIFYTIRETSEIHGKGKRLNIHKFKSPKEQENYFSCCYFCPVFASLPLVLGE